MFVYLFICFFFYLYILTAWFWYTGDIFQQAAKCNTADKRKNTDEVDDADVTKGSPEKKGKSCDNH